MIPKNILCHIQKPAATNVDLEVIQKTISDMIAKKITEVTLSNFHKCGVSEDGIEILRLEQTSTIIYSKFIL